MGSIAPKFNLTNNLSKIGILKLIGALNIEMDNEEYFYFNDVLYAVLKRKHMKSFDRKTKYAEKILRMEERKARKNLKLIRETYIKYKHTTVKNQNFFFQAVMMKSIFKGWKNYTVRDKQSVVSITPQDSVVEYPGLNSLEYDSE